MVGWRYSVLPFRSIYYEKTICEREMDMKLQELIEALDQRYGNPHASKENHLIQEAIKVLQELLEKQAK
jgi:hypothetical protein